MVNIFKEKQNKITFFVFISLLFISLIPLFATKVLPLYDYPNHMVRLHIIHNINTNPVLGQFYTVNWQLLPNLAFDIIGLFFTMIFGADTAGRIFVGLIFIIISTGTVALHYALYKKVSPWILIVFLFLYNEVLLVANLSYLFSVGFFLWVTALWIIFRKQKTWVNIAVFSTITFLLFISHLYGFCLYGLVVVGYELKQHQNAKKSFFRPSKYLILSIAQFVPSLLLYFFVSPTSTSAGSHRIGFASLIEKVISWSYIIDFYHPPLQLVVACLLLLGGAYLIWRRDIVFAKDMLFSAIILFVAFLFAPTGIIGTYFVSQRLPVAITFFLIACISIPHFNTRFRRIIPFAISLLVIIHTGFIYSKWQSFQPIYEDFFNAMNKVERASTIITVIANNGSWHKTLEPSLLYASCFSVIEKPIFVSSLFVYKTQQPLNVKPAYESLVVDGIIFTEGTLKQVQQEGARSSRNPLQNDLLMKYDYVLIVNEEFFPFPISDNFERKYASEKIKLYQKKK
ncbi:MAG TPA: hypothetical protein PLF03_03920 [Candidatus Omnitrophota bacterium]|nr:hypothetical protein [Candidatus Omnitrophota bacterium]